jgi:hypothetical protein
MTSRQDRSKPIIPPTLEHAKHKPADAWAMDAIILELSLSFTTVISQSFTQIFPTTNVLRLLGQRKQNGVSVQALKNPSNFSKASSLQAKDFSHNCRIGGTGKRAHRN